MSNRPTPMETSWPEQILRATLPGPLPMPEWLDREKQEKIMVIRINAAITELKNQIEQLEQIRDIIAAPKK